MFSAKPRGAQCFPRQIVDSRNQGDFAGGVLKERKLKPSSAKCVPWVSQMKSR